MFLCFKNRSRDSLSAPNYISLLHESVPKIFVRMNYLMLTRLLTLGSTHNLTPWNKIIEIAFRITGVFLHLLAKNIFRARLTCSTIMHLIGDTHQD
jgi:hypothetical protein